MSIITVVEQHPVAVGGGVLFLLALVLLTRGSGSSAGTVGTSSALAAQTNVALASINANAGVENRKTAAAVSIAQINANAATTKSSQDANVYRANTNAQMFAVAVQTRAAMAINASNNSVSELTTVLANGTAIASINAKTSQVNNALAANTAYASKKLQADIQMNQDTLNNKLSIVGRTLDSADMKNTNDFVLASRNLEITSSNLPLLLTHSENLASINAVTEQAKAATQAQTLEAIAAINGNTSTHNANVTGTTTLSNSLINQLGPTAAKYLGSLFGGSSTPASAAALATASGGPFGSVDQFGNVGSWVGSAPTENFSPGPNDVSFQLASSGTTASDAGWFGSAVTSILGGFI